ncbi:hypothetical protein, partial [Flavobacterium sp.]|uniref:hypothetical protein n=1 Tax=Flavobacterium sp. TaxID=239 RepID=UPI0037BEFA58
KIHLIRVICVCRVQSHKTKRIKKTIKTLTIPIPSNRKPFPKTSRLSYSDTRLPENGTRLPENGTRFS